MQKKEKASSNQSQLPIPVVSLFSGCGGMDLGIEGGFTFLGKRYPKTGFKTVWANDIDPIACETFKKWFGDVIVPGDIDDIDIKKIPKCEVVIGGFPCQDFSMIWKRGGLTTQRGNLYSYFVKVVMEKKPKVFIAENVKGLLTANGGKAIDRIVSDFSNAGPGYRTKPYPVNFAEYGTPQIRERVLIVGIRKDIKKDFVLPPSIYDSSNYITAKEALTGAEDIKYNNERQKLQQATVERLELIPPGGNFTSIPRESPHYVKGMISHVYRRLHPDKPATTIIAAGGGGTWGYHHDEPRSLTNRERARLFGYPDDFVFIGSIGEVRRQIGNSVPPVGFYPFANAIKKVI
ncbi:MAG: DNA cytosine methyltransferase [Candidatus Omnitrophica bacterium]|nr:DNA cytosine methyltransferase [Candidatus Omnitrophota bacterium]